MEKMWLKLATETERLETAGCDAAGSTRDAHGAAITVVEEKPPLF